MDHLSWKEYFMGIAKLSALRSKDPHTRVGACIVNERNIIVGIGYNGMPIGCSDLVFPWTSDGSYYDQKYAYVVHAELNAILNASAPLDGCTVYTTLFPCNECAKAIIQSRIAHIVYLDDKYADTDATRASKRMFDTAGVTYEPYKERAIDIFVATEQAE